MILFKRKKLPTSGSQGINIGELNWIARQIDGEREIQRWTRQGAREAIRTFNNRAKEANGLRGSNDRNHKDNSTCIVSNLGSSVDSG